MEDRGGVDRAEPSGSGEERSSSSAGKVVVPESCSGEELRIELVKRGASAGWVGELARDELEALSHRLVVAKPQRTAAASQLRRPQMLAVKRSLNALSIGRQDSKRSCPRSPPASKSTPQPSPKRSRHTPVKFP